MALDHTVNAMWQAQPDDATDPAAARAARVIAKCDTKLARYRAALEASANPAPVAGWTTQVQADRAAALGRAAKPSAAQRMSREEIRGVIDAGGRSTRSCWSRSRRQSQVSPAVARDSTYRPDERTVRADMEIDHTRGVMVCVEGPRRSTTSFLTINAEIVLLLHPVRA